MLQLLRIVLIFAITLSANVVANADDPRFSRVLEFEIMEICIGDAANRKYKMRICACALAKTQENSYFPDYDNDKDFWDDKEDFWDDFDENASFYANNQNSCKRI